MTIGLKLGATKFSRWVNRFGFGHTTGVQFPAEERGIVPSYDEYSGSSIGNLPIGQGLSVTPIQMMAAYAAIANGGILRQPAAARARSTAQPVDEPPGHRVIKPWVAAEIRQMLEGVLAPGGTASEVSVPGYTLAGKTGTAQVAEDGGYSETKFVASFMGFAPAANPRPAGGGDRRPALGRRVLRRRGRGAGVRRDRLLRAALPGHCPGLTRVSRVPPGPLL